MITKFALVFATLLVAHPNLLAKGHAKSFRISVTNITKGQVITPPVALAHKKSFHAAQLGNQASDAVRLLAEDGDRSGFEALAAKNQHMDIGLASGPIFPGQTVSFEITTKRKKLSILGMLATTNDAFFLAETFSFARQALAKTYDAGTEANSESCAYIPGPPCGNANVRDTADAEGYIYPHTGLIGHGDLDLSNLQWRGSPVLIKIKRIR